MRASSTPLASIRFAAWTAFIVLLCLPQLATADVVTIGVVSPVPPPAGGTFGTQLIVGNGNDEDGNDIWGLVFVDDGTFLQYGSLVIGDNFGYFGEVDVTGDFLAGKITQFNLSSVGSANNPTVQVGFEGTGWLNIDGGARMTLTNSSGDLSLGTRPSGVGHATFSDRFTMVSLSDSMYVGQQGFGELKILDGALLRMLTFTASRVISVGVDPGSFGNMIVDGQDSRVVSSANLRVGESGQGSLSITNAAKVEVGLPNPPLTGPYPSIEIGSNATAVGSVLVDGPGSRLQTQDALVVGDAGIGSLEIRNNGVVDVVDKTVDSVYVGPLGRIELAGGTLAGSSPVLPDYGTTVDGFLGGSGLVRGTVRLNENARAEAHSGDLLQFQNNVSNQGSVTVDEGEVQFLAGFTNNAIGVFNAPGRVSLERNGTVRFTGVMTNNGVLSNAHGATNIHGEINNPGTIVVARDTVASFYDPVNNSGTITILPGGNALFLADLMFSSMGALQLGIGSSELSGGSAQLSVGGVATLGGTLEVNLDGDVASLVGQSFELITASGGIVGSFDSILLPLLPNNLEVGLLYNPTSVMMEIRIENNTIGVQGDYNNDGTVNSADYTVWRNSLGSPNSLPNDSTPGVTESDYGVWKANFGLSLGSGSGSVTSGAAPEPSSLALLTFGIVALFARSHARQSSQPVAS